MLHYIMEIFGFDLSLLKGPTCIQMAVIMGGGHTVDMRTHTNIYNVHLLMMRLYSSFPTLDLCLFVKVTLFIFLVFKISFKRNSLTTSEIG